MSSTTDEYILAHFVRKYGYKPKRINRDLPSCVLVGPLKGVKDGKTFVGG